MTKKVKVFILLGQSNMVGLGKIKGGEGSLENAVKEKKKYLYLVDEAGNWIERQDVRFVRYMQGRGMLNNEWMTVAKCGTIGPEFGLAHVVGDAMDAPVMILKSCIGNRSLGWDLLPPGSERYEFVQKDKAGGRENLCLRRLQGSAGFLGDGQDQGQGDGASALARQEWQAHRLVCGQAVRRRHCRREEGAGGA